MKSEFFRCRPVSHFAVSTFSSLIILEIRTKFFFTFHFFASTISQDPSPSFSFLGSTQNTPLLLVGRRPFFLSRKPLPHAASRRSPREVLERRACERFGGEWDSDVEGRVECWGGRPRRGVDGLETREAGEEGGDGSVWEGEGDVRRVGGWMCCALCWFSSLSLPSFDFRFLSLHDASFFFFGSISPLRSPYCIYFGSPRGYTTIRSSSTSRDISYRCLVAFDETDATTEGGDDRDGSFESSGKKRLE